MICAWISTPGMKSATGVARKSSRPTAEVPTTTMCPAMRAAGASPDMTLPAET